MNETHWCEDKDTLVDYLYGELDADSRRVFEGHLRTCVPCAMEIEGLQRVRTELADWLPPQVELGFTIARPDHPMPSGAVHHNGAPHDNTVRNGTRRNGAQTIVQAEVVPTATVLRPTRWSWAAMPSWARAAAAVLIVGAGLGLANVQVRYTADGLSVSTGWMRPATPVAMNEVASGAAAAAPVSAPAWRPELATLEADLRKELQAIRTSAPVEASSDVSAGDQALLRRVQTLIEESENRQQQQLALRLSQFSRDFEMQRRADLVRLEQGLDRFQARSGAEVARQQRIVDYLYRVSTNKVP